MLSLDDEIWTSHSIRVIKNNLHFVKDKTCRIATPLLSLECLKCIIKDVESTSHMIETDNIAFRLICYK